MATKSGYKIFVVDDDASMREMIKDFLERKYPEASVNLFPTGEEALKEIYQKPDVMILDYQLDTIEENAMNGLETLKKVKNILPGLPVIFLSGQENPQVAIDTVQFGAYDYIVKSNQAFKRLEIILINALGQTSLKKNLATQKVFNTVLGIVLAAVVIMGLALRFMG